MYPLYEGEQCFRELADALPEPICVVREDGKLLYGNRYWRCMTDICEGDNFADSVLQMIHPDDRSHWMEVWQWANRSRSSYGIERRIRFTTDEHYVCHFEHGHPVRDAHGQVLEWLVVATLADEKQRLIEGLKRSLSRKEEILTEVAHELRNPLVPIANAVRMLASCDNHDRLLVERTCRLISRQVTQLTRLVEDLLDLARFEHGRLFVSCELVDLREIVTAASEVVLPNMDARGQLLDITMPARPAMVYGDAGRLTQVVVNLLANATKFTGEGGKVFVTLQDDGRLASVSVRDTGVGISTEALPGIFDAYVQVGRPAARGGLGLGLALAQHLARLHGGSLTAHSEGIGKGTEFVLRLPNDTNQRPHASPS